MTALDPRALEAALLPCPFCGGTMQLRFALWPAEGDRDAVIHAAPTHCPIEGAFCIDTDDDGVSVAEAWNSRATLPAAPATGSVEEAMPSREWLRDKIASDPDLENDAALAAAPAVQEPVAWGYIGYDGLWVATRVKELADAYAAEGIDVQPLYASPSPLPAQEVRVRKLEWIDADEPRAGSRAKTVLGTYAVWTVENGEVYVQMAHEFMGSAYGNSVERAKAAAQADYESRIKSALDLPQPQETKP